MNDYIQQGIDPATKEEELWKRFGKRHAVTVIDSSGFTRITRQYGSIYFLSKLAQKRSITIPIIKKHGCETYVTEADSLIGLFPSVQNAFDAVLEITAAIKQKKVGSSGPVEESSASQTLASRKLHIAAMHTIHI